MTEPTPAYADLVLPTDLESEDLNALAHALRIALAAHCELHILHAEQSRRSVHWSEFPHVRPLLEQWGFLAAGASIHDVEKLGLQVKKVGVWGADPVGAVVSYLRSHRPDLVVLSTRQRLGLESWAAGSAAERIARGSHCAALFVPRSSRGFVSVISGLPRLESILIPVCRSPHAGAAVEHAERLAALFPVDRGRLRLLHVGRPDSVPDLTLPGPLGWRADWLVRRGDPVEVILDEAQNSHADLVVMATTGHDAFLDALRGSTTEQVVRHATCPVLAVPARS